MLNPKDHLSLSFIIYLFIISICKGEEELFCIKGLSSSAANDISQCSCFNLCGQHAESENYSLTSQSCFVENYEIDTSANVMLEQGNGFIGNSSSFNSVGNTGIRLISKVSAEHGLSNGTTIGKDKNGRPVFFPRCSPISVSRLEFNLQNKSVYDQVLTITENEIQFDVHLKFLVKNDPPKTVTGNTLTFRADLIHNDILVSRVQITKNQSNEFSVSLDKFGVLSKPELFGNYLKKDLLNTNGQKLTIKMKIPSDLNRNEKLSLKISSLSNVNNFNPTGDEEEEFLESVETEGELEITLNGDPKSDAKLHLLPIGVQKGDEPIALDSAQKIEEAFRKHFPNASIHPALDLQANEATPGENKKKIIDEIAKIESTLNKDDMFVFFIHSHGGFGREQGDEAPVATFCDSVTASEIVGDIGERCPVIETGDENWAISSGANNRQHRMTDDEFSALFKTPKWNQVDKLFIIESCFSGGFWGNPEVNKEDSGDLSQLPRTALIAASQEGSLAYRTPLVGGGYLTAAIAGFAIYPGALDDLSPKQPSDLRFLYERILNKNLVLKDFIQQSTGDFAGDVLIDDDSYSFMSPIWGNEYPASIEPGYFETPDFLTPIELPQFIRGDTNGDGGLDITDPIFNLSYQFLGTVSPNCLAALDTNSDTNIDLSDPIYNVQHQFLGSEPPGAPFPNCGPELLDEEGALPCESSTANCQ